MLTLYPNQREEIIGEASKHIVVNGHFYYLVIAEDGNFALFNHLHESIDSRQIGRCLVDITEDMVPKDVKKVVIPQGIHMIFTHAFQDCEQLEYASIPDSCQCIGDRAFTFCDSLQSIYINRGLKEIGVYAFYACKSLKKIYLPDRIQYIGEGAFAGCRSLEQIIIPNNIKEIHDYTFANCISLKKIIIPSNVQQISYLEFIGCSSLKEVIFKDKTLEEVKSMSGYPWSIKDESTIKCEA